MNHARLQGDMALSVLDTVPLVEGATAQEALRGTLDLARLADKLGYRRYWVAEHHGMKAVASCATAVIVSELANVTSRIRVGAGGVLLPSHPPILIAEQYGTLEALHPGRIDLGMGRAQGGPRRAAELIRPGADRSSEGFARQIEELDRYFAPPQPGDITAAPAIGNAPAMWILGSGSESATLAGSLRLPYAFAAHLNSTGTVEAVYEYRRRFTSTKDGEPPYVAVSVPVIAAETDAHAEWLAGSIRLKLLSRSLGKRIRLPSPDNAAVYPYTDEDRAKFAGLTSSYMIGGPSSIREQLQAVIDKTDADELIVTSPIFGHAARRQSYKILAGVGSCLKFGQSNDLPGSPAPG